MTTNSIKEIQKTLEISKILEHHDTLNSISHGILKDSDFMRAAEKTMKSIKPIVEKHLEDRQDLAFDHCDKKEGINQRDANGNLQFTSEGEKNYNKAIRKLQATKVAVKIYQVEDNDNLRYKLPTGTRAVLLGTLIKDADETTSTGKEAKK